MKNVIVVTIVLCLSLPLFGQKTGDTIIANNPKNLKLKVLYFHITDRCHTCWSIEEHVRKTIDSLFSKELGSGVIDMYIMNCELPENKLMVQKYEAYGSTLAFSAYVNGAEEKPEDLTTWAFQKIHKPEIFITELKAKIEEHIK